MLSIRGTYTGKTIKPLAKVDKKPNTPVIITFLDHEDEASLAFEEAQSKYQKLARRFDFGETPGAGYAQEIMSEYRSTVSRI
ncbi:hypothetical protein HUU39_17315 [candidate division KSB1 bacterium]|nr:hypothetical protein [bacterium]NUM66998.1 hypothetical protein [candidate division KSB1 bacterium]